MTPEQIKQAFDNVDAMLEKADEESTHDYETDKSIGALILAVSNLRDVVKEMYESKMVEER